MEQLKTFFSGKSIGKVLDIGTGNGDFIQLISPAFEANVTITGIDPSDEALAEARRAHPSSNINFIRMEGEQLQFSDQSFDVVCLSNAMHHLADQAKTLSEMKRVIKPEGFLIIAEIVSDGLNQAQENQKMFHHFKSFVDQKSGITHRETWTEAEVLEIIQSNGIQPVLTFPFNRMSGPITDVAKLEGWIQAFALNLSKLEGQPEYDEKAALFEQFKARLSGFGFQLARQIVMVGTK
jgi:2-polyprenyl-3-methyl-5-hydroxy-6-metoxy-1,4-benzoquinol methylase